MWMAHIYIFLQPHRELVANAMYIYIYIYTYTYAYVCIGLYTYIYIFLQLSLFTIFVYFEAIVHEPTILSFPPPTCIAHPGAI